MRWVSNIRFRIRAILRPDRMEKEMDEEMAFHLDMEVRKLMREGLDPAHAHREALRNFGEPMQQRERARDSWGVRWIQDLRSDARLTARRFRKDPGFSIVAILTVALGVGATTAIFTVVHGVLLKPLPYPDPDGLVALTHNMPAIDVYQAPLGPALFLTFRDHSSTLQDVGFWRPGIRTVTGLAEPEEVQALQITPNLLPMLGLTPVIGRGFSQDEGSPGSTIPVLLSNGYWKSHFGADPDVLGRTIRVQGEDLPIVGVLPPDARIQDRNPDLILPLHLNEASQAVGNWSLPSIARLEPGVTAAQATAELSQLTPLACELYPGIPLEELERRGFRTLATPLKIAVVGEATTVLWVVFGTMGLVLLIACTNLANLFLAKAESHVQDLALRKALGASRGRTVRQTLTESILVGLVGGATGLVLAHGGTLFLVRMAPPALPRLEEIALEPIIILFALVITLAVGALLGVLSSTRGGAAGLVTSMNDGGRGGGGGSGGGRARNVLATVQIALALVLLVGSGLMVRTFLALRSVPPGYERPTEVLTFRLTVPASDAPTPDDVAEAHREIIRRLSEIPEVTSVSAAFSVAMESWESWEDMFMEDFPVAEGDPNPLRRLNWITPGHFATLENPLRAGRSFEWPDVMERRHVAIVSEAFAREFWPTPEQAVGKRFRTGGNQPWKVIVGVAGDVHTEGVQEAPPSIVFFPFVMDGMWGTQTFASRGLRYAIRTTRPRATDILPTARQAVWSVNPQLPLSSVQTLEEIFAGSIARTSFAMVMLGTAAGVALFLGMVGVYGVVSYVVSQRTREMGIRMAIGATARQVRGMVLRQGGSLAGTGIVLGIGVAYLLSRLMASLLFGVSPVDPVTYGAVSSALMAVVLLASYLPARKAAGVDPTEALKRE